MGKGWNPPAVGMVRKAPARVAMAKVMPVKGERCVRGVWFVTSTQDSANSDLVDLTTNLLTDPQITA